MGSIQSTAIVQSSEIKFRPEPRVPCPKTIRSPGRFRYRRVHYHLDKKAIDAQLLDLSSKRGRQPTSAFNVAYCVGQTSEGPRMTPPGRIAAFTAAAFVRA